MMNPHCFLRGKNVTNGWLAASLTVNECLKNPQPAQLYQRCQLQVIVKAFLLKVQNQGDKNANCLFFVINFMAENKTF